LLSGGTKVTLLQFFERNDLIHLILSGVSQTFMKIPFSPEILSWLFPDDGMVIACTASKRQLAKNSNGYYITQFQGWVYILAAFAICLAIELDSNGSISNDLIGIRFLGFSITDNSCFVAEGLSTLST